MKNPIFKKLFVALGWPFILCILVWQLSDSSSREKINIDEVYWVGQSYYFNLAFIEKDLDSPRWQLHTAKEHPPLGKYLYGTILTLAGAPVGNMDLLGLFYLKFKKWPKAWGKGEDYQKRLEITEQIQPETVAEWDNTRRINADRKQIRIARLMAKGLGVLTAIAVYFIGFQLRGFFCGAVASTVFVTHPISTGIYSHAHMDIVMLFFTTLSLAVFLKVCIDANNGTKPGTYTSLPLILVGAASVAFACGSKMSGTITALVGIALCIHLLLFTNPGVDRNHAVKSILIILAGSFLIFWVLNPTMYSNPLSGMWAHITEHNGVVKIQMDMGLKPVMGIYSKWNAIARALVSGSIFLMFFIIVAVYYYYRSVKNDHALLVCSYWWWTAFICTLAWIPFPWSRYVIPLVPPFALLAGVFANDLLQHISRLGARIIPRGA